MEQKLQDMKVAGAGSVAGGEYGKISVSGAVSIGDTVRCTQLHVAGSGKSRGSILCSGDVDCAGSFSCGGDLEGELVKIAGSCKICGRLKGQRMKIAGSVKAEKGISGNEIRIAGSCYTEGNVEGEQIYIDGGGQIAGTLNGELIRIRLGSSKSRTDLRAGDLRVGTLGGASITVETVGEPSSFLSRILHRDAASVCLLADAIEGDDLTLCNTECKIVRGKTVVIGENCKIDRLEYTDSCEVADSSVVGVSEKV